MKTKLLFAAAVMTVAGVFTQSVHAEEEFAFSLQTEDDGMSEMEVLEEEDYSDKIVNANCQSDAYADQAWVRNSLNASAGYLIGASVSDVISDIYSGTGVEFWRSPSSDGWIHNKNLISQTVYDLPIGLYRVEAYVTGRDQGANPQFANDNMYFFANDGKVNVKTMTWDKFQVEATVDASRSLTIGVGGTANWNNWEAISHVKLYALNTYAALQKVITVAYGVKDNANVSNVTFEDAISAAEKIGEGETPAAYKQAMETLRIAIKTYVQDIASETSPYDFSGLLNKGAGWPEECFYTAWTHKSGHTDNFAYSGTVAERWHEAFDMYRTLTGLPNGKYELSVQGACSENNEDFYFYAERTGMTFDNKVAVYTGSEGGGSALEQAARAMNSDQSSVFLQTIKVNVTDGKLTVGLKCIGNASWCVWNKINVKYLGTGNFDENTEGCNWEELYKEYSQNARKDLLTLDGKIPAAMKTAINSALDKSSPTENDCNILRDAIVVGKAAVTPYADLQSYKTTVVENFRDQTIATKEGVDALAAAMTNVNETLEAATTLDDIAAIYPMLLDAKVAYACTLIDLAEGVESVDMTFLIQQAGFEGINTAWSRTAESDGFLRFMDPNPNNLGRNIRFIESYINPDNNDMSRNNNKVLVCQKLSGMPVGSYTFESTAFNRQANFTATEPANPVMVYLNDTDVEVNSEVFSETLIAVDAISKDGNVEFGLKSGDNLNTSWHGLADVHLYYKGALTAELTENEANEDVADGIYYREVKVNRTLNADKWNTFCMPFDMTAEEMADNHITEVRKLTDAVANGDDMTLTFEAQENIEAGVPYIVKTDDTVSELKVSGKTLSTEAGTAVALNVTMYGNYGLMTLQSNDYFIQNNMFYYVDPDDTRAVKLKGFRAYLRLQDQAAMVNRMLIDIDGVTTSVEDVLGEDILDGDRTVDVYTLSGIRMKSGVRASEALDGLAKGVYVINGRKVVK